jgi:hypothetical protein
LFSFSSFPFRQCARINFKLVGKFHLGEAVRFAVGDKAFSDGVISRKGIVA